MPIYLDYNATTPCADEVKTAIEFAITRFWGNPSSSHIIGREAKKLIEESRTKVSWMIDANSDQIIFTSGGTECNYMVIENAVSYFKGKKSWCNHQSSKPHVITTNIEHDSIRLHLQALMDCNVIDVSFVPVLKETGQVCVEDILNEVRNETILITVMMANNETGIIQPIQDIGCYIEKLNLEKRKDTPVLFHTDAAQATGKIQFSVKELKVDFLTIAGHKFYGPRIGALYVKSCRLLSSVFFGGGQEKGLRPGTENTAMIAGLGKAAELVQMNFLHYYTNMIKTRDYLEEKLLEKFKEKVVFNNIRKKQKENDIGEVVEEYVPRLPNTVNVAFRISDITSTLILERAPELCASTGAACHSSQASSSVLVNSGVDETLATTSIRLSTGRETSKLVIDKAVEYLWDAMNEKHITFGN